MSKHKPRLDIYPFSDLGKRDYQEDYFYTDPPAREGRPWLGIVCDGMGGHAHGDLASQAGVHAIKQAFDAAIAGGKSTDRALADATQQGHEAVLRAAEEAGSRGDMGSTVVAFAIEGPTLHWCSAGDSRLYLCRADKLLQLSRDFTVGEDMRQGMSGGGWSEEDIENSPQRNALTSFMGTDEWRSHCGSKALQHGDIVVACSDGVYGTIESDGIVAACRSNAGMASAQVIAESMQKRVLDVGKQNQDNSTAIVVRILRGGEEASSGGWTTPAAWALGGSSVVAIAVMAVIALQGSGSSDGNVKVNPPPPPPSPAIGPASSPPPAPARPPPPPPPPPPDAPAPAIVDEATMEAQRAKIEKSLADKKYQDVIAQVDVLLVKRDSNPTPAVARFQARLQKLRDDAWIKSLERDIAFVKTKPTAERSSRLDGVIKTYRPRLNEINDTAKRTKANAILRSAESEREAKKNDPQKTSSNVSLKPDTGTSVAPVGPDGKAAETKPAVADVAPQPASGAASGASGARSPDAPAPTPAASAAPLPSGPM